MPLIPWCHWLNSHFWPSPSAPALKYPFHISSMALNTFWVCSVCIFFALLGVVLYDLMHSLQCLGLSIAGRRGPDVNICWVASVLACHGHCGLPAGFQTCLGSWGYSCWVNPGMSKTALSIIHVNAYKCLKHYKANDMIDMIDIFWE